MNCRLRYFRSAIGRAHRVGRVSGLNLQFSQNPDAIAKFDGLIEHVLAIDLALSNREHIIVTKLLRAGI